VRESPNPVFSIYAQAVCQNAGWLVFALPINTCGLKLDDKAVKIAAGLRLGAGFCEPNPCGDYMYLW